MTDRATLEAIIARVLEGTGPDRELDAEIARALGWKPLYRDDYSKWWPPSAVEYARERKRSILHHPTQPLPMFTTSLDNALTLVPEGWCWEIYSDGIALLWKQPPEPSSIRRTVTAPRCATPARALIAACIKARMEALGE